MKKNVFYLRLCSASFLFSSLQAFAAPSVVRNTNEPSSQRDFTPDEINQIKEILVGSPLKPYSINPYGLLQGNVNFLDTTRNNTPDFTVTHARLGVFAVEKNWSGKLELEFNGNQPQNLFPEIDPQPVFLSQSASNTAGVRQAQINFDFLRFIFKDGVSRSHNVYFNKSALKYQEDAQILKIQQVNADVPKTPEPENEDDPQSASVLTDGLKRDTSFVSRMSLGGIRVGGAIAVSTDASYTPSGFGRQDGIYFLQNAAFGKDVFASFGLGVFNNLSTTTIGEVGSYQGWGAYSGTSSNYLGILGVTSPTFQKAYVFTTNWLFNLENSRNINFIAYYGFQHNAAVNTNQNGFATTTRNAQHFETSITYADDNVFGTEGLVTGNGVGIWFEDEYGSNQSLTTAAPDLGRFKPSLNDGYNATLYGIGIAGDTKPYYTDLLFDADRLLYAATLAFVNGQFQDSEYSPNYQVVQASASVGYGYRTLEFHLVGDFAFASKNAFAKFDITQQKSDTGLRSRNVANVYFTGALFF